MLHRICSWSAGELVAASVVDGAELGGEFGSWLVAAGEGCAAGGKLGSAAGGLAVGLDAGFADGEEDVAVAQAEGIGMVD